MTTTGPTVTLTLGANTFRVTAPKIEPINTTGLTTDQAIKAHYDAWMADGDRKYAFYRDTINYPISRVAAVTGIDRAVIRDRRNYVRIGA